MKSQEFCYWLQGWIEMANPTTITPEQMQVMRNHLALVFKHEIDPQYTNLNPVEAQAIHDAGKVQIGGTEIGPNGETIILRC